MAEGRLNTGWFGGLTSLTSHLSSLTFILLLFTSCQMPYVGYEYEEAEAPTTSTTRDTLACTLYKGHVIAYSHAIHPDSLQLTLISLQEWTNLPSALNIDNPYQSIQLAANYSEYGLADWHIPTIEEAKHLRTLYATMAGIPSSDTVSYSNGFQITISCDSTPLNILNNLLFSQQATPITLTAGITNARYLCDEGTKTFSFVTGTTISKAGTKATTYRLRLLKTLVVTQ